MPDHHQTHEPRVRAEGVLRALTDAGLTPLPDGKTRGRRGVQVAQMKDAVLVVAAGVGPQEHAATREQARAAVRAAGYLVKDSPRVEALLYVIDGPPTTSAQ